MEATRRDILRQLALAVAGSIITFLLFAIWAWISAGGLVGFLGGLTVGNFSERVEEPLKERLKAELRAEWRKELQPVATKAIDDLPDGAIIAWYAEFGSIPDGWIICDGTNETPDLRNRFLRGGVSIADLQGESSQGGKETVSIPGLDLTVYASGWDGSMSQSPNGGPEENQSWGSNRWHRLLSKGSIPGKEIEILPPYQVVLFIMKKSS